MRRRIVVVVVVALVASFGLLAVVPVASAAPATTLGSVPTAAQMAGAGYWNAGELILSPATIPATGKVVAFQYRDTLDETFGAPSTTTGAITFDIWRPTGTEGQLELVHSSGPIAIDNDDSILTWNPPGKRGGWSVEAGDYFGVYLYSGNGSIDYVCGGCSELPEILSATAHYVGATASFSTNSGYGLNGAVSFRAKGKPTP